MSEQTQTDNTAHVRDHLVNGLKDDCPYCRIHKMTMRCPDCGEVEKVECHNDRRHHVHECHQCGHKDIYRQPK